MSETNTDIIVEASPEAKQAFSTLAKNWWLPLVEGILSIIVGIYSVFHFGSGFLALSLVIAVFLTISGVVGLVGSLFSGKYEGKFIEVVLSILRLIGGILLIVMPGLAEMTLIIVAGASFLSQAVSTVTLSWFMKKAQVDGWGWIMALGILLILNSFIIIANPFISIMLISINVSAELLIAGFHDLYVAFQMKQLKNALA